MSPPIRTRLTDLFGIRYPILAGGMMWLSRAEFVAACGRAGCLGFMTPRSYDSPADFRAGLELALRLAEGAPIGVNLTLPRHGTAVPTREYLRIALDLGVRRFETAGSEPGDIISLIHRGGGVVIHKCTRPRHALAAARDGADAICLVGMEAGGHPGTNPHPAHLLAAASLPDLKVPLALGGGIGTGAQMLSALALGADGVVIGTRFLAAHEIQAHPRYKDRLCTAGIDDTTRVLERYGVTWRVLRNETASEVLAMETDPATRYQDFGQRVTGRLGRDKAYIGGCWEQGLLSCSGAVGFIKKEQPVSAIITELCDDFHHASHRLVTILNSG